MTQLAGHQSMRENENGMSTLINYKHQQKLETTHHSVTEIFSKAQVPKTANQNFQTVCRMMA